jgi:hypothetical protein
VTYACRTKEVDVPLERGWCSGTRRRPQGRVEVLLCDVQCHKWQHLTVSHTYSAKRRSRLQSSEVAEVDLLDPDPNSGPAYWVGLSPSRRNSALREKLGRESSLFYCVFSSLHLSTIYRVIGGTRAHGLARWDKIWGGRLCPGGPAWASHPHPPYDGPAGPPLAHGVADHPPLMGSPSGRAPSETPPEPLRTPFRYCRNPFRISLSISDVSKTIFSFVEPLSVLPYGSITTQT